MEPIHFPYVLPPLASLPSGDGMHHVRLKDRRTAWLKRRFDQPAAFLATEAHGLERLRAARGLRVPRVLALQEHQLLLEDLGHARPTSDFSARAGQGLALQHICHGRSFGLDINGWCGDTPQDNTPDDDGYRFFAERRLRPLAHYAHVAGRLDAATLGRIERICGCLDAWIPAQPPVLLHGDLWSGNLHCCADGEPALIDAGAVHYGWAEADLAMLVLFGDPGPRLFAAYAEHAPLQRDWRERAPLYNLYHLLNHLLLFGGGYLEGVQSVVRRFAGKR